MKLTRIKIADITTDSQLSENAALVLASHTLDGTAKLVWCKWCAGESDDAWQSAINVTKLSKHHHVVPRADWFVDACELNGNDIEQQLLLATMAQIKQYLHGQRQIFTIALDHTLGTPFQQRVWQALQDIAYGETISYAELAKQVDNPKGYRAVAQANGKNPFSIIVPCHRVISSSGQLGGYTGGLDKKRHLLALEGHTF